MTGAVVCAALDIHQPKAHHIVYLAPDRVIAIEGHGVGISEVVGLGGRVVGHVCIFL